MGCSSSTVVAIDYKETSYEEENDCIESLRRWKSRSQLDKDDKLLETFTFPTKNRVRTYSFSDDDPSTNLTTPFMTPRVNTTQSSPVKLNRVRSVVVCRNIVSGRPVDIIAEDYSVSIVDSAPQLNSEPEHIRRTSQIRIVDAQGDIESIVKQDIDEVRGEFHRILDQINHKIVL